MTWPRGIFLLCCFWPSDLAQQPPARQTVMMSMMPDAFDDQYIGCAKEMETEAPALMKNELEKSTLLKRAWKNSSIHWEEVREYLYTDLPKGFKEEHGRAIIAYTDNFLRRQLNKAVQESGASSDAYHTHFHFKAFHYYLTRALQLLRMDCNLMYEIPVYRGVHHIRYQHNGCAPIRFGYFASSSFEIKKAEEFGKDTFFTIHTCFGVPILYFSYILNENEALIPVNEIFSVFPGDSGDNSFVLRSTNRTCSYFNCAFLGCGCQSGPSPTSACQAYGLSTGCGSWTYVFSSFGAVVNSCTPSVRSLDISDEKRKSCEYNAAERQGIAFQLQMSPALFGGSIVLVNAAALQLFAAF